MNGDTRRTIGGLLKDLSTELRLAGFACPAYEARQILQEILGLDASSLVKRIDETIVGELAARALQWGEERRRGVPLAYLTGRKGFYKHEFVVGPGVLVPRPESELVVEEALRRASDPLNLADLGAGSGCIGLSLLGEWPQARLTAIDLSPDACRTVETNGRRLNLLERVKIVNLDVESYVPDQQFHVIVANPPYLPLGDPRVDPAVHAFEPHLALYAGEDGLEAVRAWSEWSLKHLASQGLFVCEFGSGQRRQVEQIIKDNGFADLEVVTDLGGHERVISARKEG
ncbi:MAG: peptide chain release factor N(5)-glutamine methyltransferase [Bdellovibrionales bacterium]